MIQNFLFFFVVAGFAHLYQKWGKFLASRALFVLSPNFSYASISQTPLLFSRPQKQMSATLDLFILFLYFSTMHPFISLPVTALQFFLHLFRCQKLWLGQQNLLEKNWNQIYTVRAALRKDMGGERYSFFSCFSYVLVGSAFKFENQGVAVFLFFNNAWLSLCNNTCLNFSNKSWRRNNVNQKGKKCLGKGNHQYIVLVGN